MTSPPPAHPCPQLPVVHWFLTGPIEPAVCNVLISSLCSACLSLPLASPSSTPIHPLAEVVDGGGASAACLAEHYL